jgi:hypothetical protein
MINDNFTSPCANSYIVDRELEELVNKFGSFITLVTNKPVSCVTMFILINKYPELRNSMIAMSETTWYSIVEYLAHRYPVLNKSKKIKK